MLSYLRKSLADTIDAGLRGQARVFAYPPLKVDMPATGAFVYVQPDPNEYVMAWTTFTTGGRAEIRYEIHILCPDDNPARRWDQLDDLIDPVSDGVNVFGAILADPTLGVTAFEVTATPLLGSVSAPGRMSEADNSVTFYELILPVHVIAKRS